MGSFMQSPCFRGRGKPTLNQYHQSIYEIYPAYTGRHRLTPGYRVYFPKKPGLFGRRPLHTRDIEPPKRLDWTESIQTRETVRCARVHSAAGRDVREKK